MTNEEKIYQVLDDLHIAYERLDHEPISSVIEAAEKGIVLPGQQVKNLVLKSKKGRQFYLVILRDEKRANIKHLAEVLDEKRLSFAKFRVSIVAPSCFSSFYRALLKAATSAHFSC